METDRVIFISRLLGQAIDCLDQVRRLFKEGESQLTGEEMERLSIEKDCLADHSLSSEQRVIEGIFNGQSLLAVDGKIYDVPANYASKSKLIEGDKLKLSIRPDGRFVFKQIGPVERQRVTAILAHDAAHDRYIAVSDDGSRWNILRASITYYQAEPGDEMIILTPKGAGSSWAAVENVIKMP